jgi:hypothetical protein
MGRPRQAARAAAAVAGGGALLLWPALLNGYPLVFVDTASFLHQTAVAPPVWDKPVVYGPLLHAFHWRSTLWPAAAAQALLLSWLLWRAARMLWGPATGAGAHLLLVAALAAGTAAPWFSSLLMPDALAPALVLAVALLGWGEPRPAERAGLLLVAALAAAAHLAHLPLLGALLLVLAALRRWRGFRDGAAAGAAALLLVVATNAIFQGRAAVSPYGAVFALARLVADGPAARTVEARCPEAGWHLCRWAGRLPADSDEFLWSPDGPVWGPRLDGALPGGPISLAAEAGTVLRETLGREPWGVLRAAAANTVRQLLAARTGDTLVPDHLAESVTLELARSFPAGEQARSAASLQFRGALPAAAAPFSWPHVPALLAGALALPLAFRRALRGCDARLLGFLLCVCVGVLANAAVTGALSGPHDRYGARVAWLLPLAGLLAWRPRRSAGVGRRQPPPAAAAVPAAGAAAAP